VKVRERSSPFSLNTTDRRRRWQEAPTRRSAGSRRRNHRVGKLKSFFLFIFAKSLLLLLLSPFLKLFLKGGERSGLDLTF